MFRATLNYMHRVEVVLFFVAASRNADMTLRLAAGEQLSKLFLSMNRIKYKRLWPRYISYMHDLRTTYPDTWNELVGGSLSVSKNGIPFTSVGADHACEHLNRQMKVKSGLVGISIAMSMQGFFFWLPRKSHSCPHNIGDSLIGEWSASCQSTTTSADYLEKKVLTYNTDSPKLAITSSSGCTRSNGSVEFEDNNREEADTLMIHHAVLSSRRNSANARIVIFSPDTDVLVLAVANHHLLLRNTSVSMVSGVIDVEPIARALADKGHNYYLHYMHFPELIQL